MSVLLLQSTYSIFTAEDIDDELNVYKTGNLSVSVTGSNTVSSVTRSDNFSAPMLTPYHLVVTNNGTVPYMFDIILNDTTSGTKVSYNYIYTKVGSLDAKKLADCSGNVIKNDVILLAGESVAIDVRVFYANDIPSTEISKSFSAQIKINGEGVYDSSKAGDFNNNILSLAKKTSVTIYDMPIGSYINYVGNNGCSGDACNGAGANHSSTYPNGYCYNNTYSYISSGWRIAYRDDDAVYITTAGAPECVSTDKDGVKHINASAHLSTHLSSNNLNIHINNLNSEALNYCNTNFAYGRVCNNLTAWALNENDINSILSINMSALSCFENSSVSCGSSNTLINNGGYYFLASIFNINSSVGYWDWSPLTIRFNMQDSNVVYGMRPVIKINPDTLVTGGTGTSSNPYTISASTAQKTIKDIAVGKYINYTANNGCSGDACKGKNVNVTANTNGYCYSEANQYNPGGWIVAYKDDVSVYITTAGAPECVSSEGYGALPNNPTTAFTASTLNTHLSTLNTRALKYCNTTYVYGGTCNNTVAHAFNATDFEKVTGVPLNSSSCSDVSNISCGLDNYVIDNGGYYWIASPFVSGGNKEFYWSSHLRFVSSTDFGNRYGLRPVVRLKNSLKVGTGTGDVDSPYNISN